MAQYTQTTPLEERVSKQPITFMGFLRETWTVPAAWLGGAVVGFLYSKSRGYQAGSIQQQAAIGIPAKLGAFAAFFMVWQKSEKQRLGIEEIYDKYKTARSTRLDNTAIEKDNQVIRQMIAHEERNIESPSHIKGIIEQGARDHKEHASHSHDEQVIAR